MKLTKTILLLICATLLTALAAAAGDTSALRPPAGVPVAIMVFEDLECPQCARVSPILEEAARTYKIPLLRHDFPLRQHPWSFDAAVLARFFDTQSKKMGDEFREQVFANQTQITKDNLRAFAQQFATKNKVTLPFAIDPRGELTAKVKGDQDLGTRIGLEHTPTIYVVANKTQGQPFTEVTDPNQLYQVIDQMKKEATPVVTSSTSSTTKKPSHKTTKQ